MAYNLSVDPMDFGATGDGNTDDSAAWQAAINTGKVVIPSNGEYLINTTVSLPEGTAIYHQGHGSNNKVIIKTTAAIDTFYATGPNGSIAGLAFHHTGPSGRCFKQNNYGAWHIRENYFRATNDGNVASDIIHTSGALSWYAFNAFDNYRKNPDSFCIAFDKSPADVYHCIENHVDMNYCGGQGPFGYIGSREGRYNYNTTTKPEGIHFTNNTVQTFNYSLVIECVLEAHISGNSFCIANGITLLLRPTGPGIIDIRSTGNWYDSTGNNNISGVVTNDDNYRNGPSAVIKTARFMDFFYQGKYGAVFGPYANNIDFSGSTFLQMTEVGIICNQTTNVTINASFDICPRAFSLIDSIDGGPFLVGKCHFMSGSVPELVMTNKSKFEVTHETSGAKLARKFVGLAPTNGFSSAASGVSNLKGFVQFPHGLTGTPNLDKCQCSIQSLSSGGAAFEGASAFFIASDSENITLGVYIMALVTHGNIGYNLSLSV